jgi:GAF domain-containing protein
VYDINTDEFRVVSAVGPGAEQRRGTPIPSTAGLFGAAVRSGLEALVVQDVARDARFDAGVDGRVGVEVHGALYLVLHKADNLLGMVQLLNRTKRRDFGEADVAVASYVAAQVAEFLQSRRLSARPRR